MFLCYMIIKQLFPHVSKKGRKLDSNSRSGLCHCRYCWCWERGSMFLVSHHTVQSALWTGSHGVNRGIATHPWIPGIMQIRRPSLDEFEVYQNRWFVIFSDSGLIFSDSGLNTRSMPFLNGFPGSGRLGKPCKVFLSSYAKFEVWRRILPVHPNVFHICLGIL